MTNQANWCAITGCGRPPVYRVTYRVEIMSGRYYVDNIVRTCEPCSSPSAWLWGTFQRRERLPRDFGTRK